MKTQKGFAVVSTIFIIIILFVGGYYLVNNANDYADVHDWGEKTEGEVTQIDEIEVVDQGITHIPEEEIVVVCTMDAKQCPDGSFVGRTGPDCEFICPIR